MPKSQPWKWGTALILTAALTLGILGFLGLRSQRAAIYQDAQKQSQKLADQLAIHLTREAPNHATQIKTYPYPPKPGTTTFNPKADLTTLHKWKISPEKTTTGLPINVLAQLAILKITNTPQDAKILQTLALKTNPSTITPNILTHIQTLAKKHQWPGDWTSPTTQWQQDEQARQLLQKNTPGWTSHNNQIYWISPQQNKILHPSDLQDLVTKQYTAFVPPTWSIPILTTANTPIDPSINSLAKSQNQNLTIHIALTDPALLEANYRSNKNWTIAIISLAIIAVTAGLIFLIRSIIQEQKLTLQKSNFIASVTHELRSPIGSIRLMAETLEQQKSSPEKIQKFHHLIARESSRLSSLIENVLDLSRLEGNKLPISPRPIPLHQIITETKQTLQIQAEEKNIAIHLQGPELTINADPSALQQALINLLDNAIKFSPENTKIQITWKPGHTITITDQGPGIPEDLQSKVFTRFYRAEQDELRRQTKGAGIGLTLVQHIIYAHSGTIEIQNIPGASFTIHLPQNP